MAMSPLRGEDPAAAVARAYQAFARHEARGRSPAYERLAESVADDPVLVAYIGCLPPAKRQPQLVFAAARYLLGAVPGIEHLRELVSRERAELTNVIMTKRTQTNEPGRCALLLPVLAQLPQPLALIEAGASAGLTLLLDRYSYDYGGYRITGSDPRAPILRCETRGPVPLPRAVPAIAWRCGLDLNPLDVNAPDDVRWLTCLVWPGESDRQQRLAAAIASARRDPPAVYRGDLLTDLPALAARAPVAATLVIYHSSVLYQVAPDMRDRLAATVRALGATWISCEAPGTVPGIRQAGPGDMACLLARDRQAIAVGDSHGTWLQWLP
jgi:hypothetical protein